MSKQTQKEQEIQAMQHIVFKLGDDYFAVPILDVHTVEDMKEITPVPKAPSFVNGVINLRGEVIPVLSLKRRLGYEEDFIAATSKIMVLMLEDDEPVGVLIDEIDQVLNISEDIIDEKPEIVGNIDTLYLKGIARHDNLIMLLDTSQIVDDKLKS